MSDDRRTYVSAAGVAAIPQVTSSTPPPVPAPPSGARPGGTRMTNSYRLPMPIPGTARHDALRAVLVSWLVANGIDTWGVDTAEGITVEGRSIDYHEPIRTGGVQQRSPVSGRPLTAEVSWPLSLSPRGVLAEEWTCGHIDMIDPRPPVPRAAVCIVDVDPDTDRHPGHHRDKTGHTWTNQHPGGQPFRDGIPDVTGMAPDAIHDLVRDRLHRLEFGVSGPGGLAAGVVHAQAHAAGLRQLTKTHAPDVDRSSGPWCAHPRIGERWPCPEYLNATAGLICGLDPA